MKADANPINGTPPASAQATGAVAPQSAARSKKPGAMHTAHLLLELSKDSAGIVSALETLLAPLLAPGLPSPPMPDTFDDPAESVMINTMNAAGSLSAWNRKRLEALVERLRV